MASGAAAGEVESPPGGRVEDIWITLDWPQDAQRGRVGCAEKRVGPRPWIIVESSESGVKARGMDGAMLLGESSTGGGGCRCYVIL